MQTGCCYVAGDLMVTVEYRAVAQDYGAAVHILVPTRRGGPFHQGARLDCFYKEPHYHIFRPNGDEMMRKPLVANGYGIEEAVTFLEQHALLSLLKQGGYEGFAVEVVSNLPSEEFPMLNRQTRAACHRVIGELRFSS